MLVLSIFVLCVYSVLMVGFAYGWVQTENYQSTGNAVVFVSIIIACRNEAPLLESLIRGIAQLNYPKSKFEVLFVNDHSLDATWEMMQQFKLENMLCYNLSAEEEGKKAALAYAAKRARGELLLFTDADCKFSPNWIASFANYYAQYRPEFIAGPVCLTGEGWWASLQRLEFMSLQITGAGSMALKLPIMCNGANMAVTKQVYLDNLNSLQTQFASGDDMFLLLALKKRNADCIHFLKDRGAIVSTPAQEKLGTFLSQRRRWAGKATGYTDVWVIFVGLVVLLTNIVLIVWLISLQSWTYISLLMAKTGVDFVVLGVGSRFFGAQQIMWYTLPLQIVYPFYVLLSVVPWKKTAWKGRVVQAPL